MKYSILVLVLFAALLLAGCAPPPSYYGTNAAPVVDRSTILRREDAQPDVAAIQEPAPAVEVTPLQPRQELQPRVEPLDTEPAPSTPEPTAVTPEPVAPAPKPAPPQDNQAVVALLDSAADSVGNGDLDQAASSLERALRIEPRNAGIWHDLGQIRLHQREYGQAEAMFSKSNALAGGNNSLKARNWRMIAAARRAGGDAGGADAAQAQAVSLEN